MWPRSSSNDRAAGAGVWTNIGAADTSNPYGVSWDTTGVADGLYDLRAVSTDNVGNTTNSTAVTNVRVDNTGPTATMTGPSSSTSVTGSISVSATSTDTGGSGVASVQFERSAAGAGVWTNIGAADTSNPYGVSWDTTGVADGLYDLRAVSTDNVGNTTNSTAVTNVRVDNTGPIATMTGPSSSTSVTGSISVSATSTDTGGSGVASVQFERSAAGAGSWTNIGAAEPRTPTGSLGTRPELRTGYMTCARFRPTTWETPPTRQP